MKKKNVFILFLLICLSFVYITNNKKIVMLEKVSLKETNQDFSSFAVMVEQEDGTYEEVETDTWNMTGYLFDAKKSECIGENGEIIKNSLSFDYSKKEVIVNTTKTAYCYVYFSTGYLNLYEACEEYNSLGECAENEYLGTLNMIDNLKQTEQAKMKRFTGSNSKVQNNYICFGVNTLEDCLGENYKDGIYDETKFSKYVYRIIGINSEGKLKLIKKEALESGMNWYGTYGVYAYYPNSLIYKNLNGSSFLENEDYVPSEEWKNKISEEPWRFGMAINYKISTDIELSFGDTTKENYNPEREGIINGKIGVMYVHDYNLANGWIHLQYNDASNLTNVPYVPSVDPPVSTEWLMSVYSYNGSFCMVYFASSSSIQYSHVTVNKSTRPVFFLTNNSKIISGDGTATNPYLLS